MMFLDNRKGETQWATKAVRKIRKRVRSRTLINRNKSQKTSLISSPKEGLDRGILGTILLFKAFGNINRTVVPIFTRNKSLKNRALSLVSVIGVSQ